ncbi:MAG: nucleotidyl transferase AbiEii/AbiGii toxin family protein [Patescibacteria group bacterium]|nr:nucleotidyl transferase AbiEii/AbiGii toxin family protein [Patescibacteria group bacterium]
MLNQAKHRMQMINILLKLYKDSESARVLGFKGGTAAYLFYDLPRFSVDLDFDLLVETDKIKRNELIKKMTGIFQKDFEIREQSDKRFTLFWLLSYKKGDRQLKIEVSKRKSDSKFEDKPFYGVNIPVMKLQDAMANKLMALADRKKFANRDVFDAWYFLSKLEAEEINYELIKERLGLMPKKLYQKILKRINKKRGESVLQGMGELLTEKQKSWVKNKLLSELNQLIRIHLDSFLQRRILCKS